MVSEKIFKVFLKYKTMGAICCHDNQSSNPISSKTFPPAWWGFTWNLIAWLQKISWIALIPIFATVKTCNSGIIYLHHEWFHKGFCFQETASTKFHENKTLMKFSVYRSVPKMTSRVICLAVLMPVRSCIPFAVDPTIKQNVRPERYS